VGAEVGSVVARAGGERERVCVCKSEISRPALYVVWLSPRGSILSCVQHYFIVSGATFVEHMLNPSPSSSQAAHAPYQYSPNSHSSTSCNYTVS